MPRKPKRRNFNRRRRRRRTAPAQRKSGGLVADLVTSGVRTLVAALPFSSVVSPLAEIFLTSIGLSGKVVDGSFVSDVSIIGLSSFFAITYVNILARSPLVDLTDTMPQWADVPYRDGRLISLTITVRPSSILSKRQGKWAMAFIPRRETTDKLRDNARVCSLRYVEKMEGSVSGMATTTLTLRFRPRPRDGFVTLFNPLEEIFGYVALAFQDDIRSSYTQFTTEEFAPDITVSGTLALKTFPTQSSLGYRDSVWSLKGSASVLAVPTGMTYVFDTDAKIEAEVFPLAPTEFTGKCKITGKFASYSSAREQIIPDWIPKTLDESLTGWTLNDA